MASNPYVNKVIYGDQTVMDISDTTANEGDVAEGEVFFKCSGQRAVGTGNYYSPSDTAETDLEDGDYIPFYDTSESGKRKSLWSNIKAKLKTYFDTLYQTILTFDDAPKEFSNNPVKSSGIYRTVQGADVLVDETVGYVKKNLFHIDSSVVSTTNNGITFTVYRNSDGEVESIRVSGETTDPSTEAVLDLGRFNLNFNTYILSGGLDEHIFLRLKSDGDPSAVLEDTGEGAEFTLGFYADEYNHAYLVVSDYDIPWRFDVYPMIRYAEIGSNKFYPYNSKETVQTQLDNKVITLTKAQYDTLPSADKLDPSKVYYVTDYDPVPVYAPLDDSTTAADKVWSSQKVNTQKADNSVIAPVESGATASKAYAVGEHFIRDGAFCTAKTAIASGATFTLNTNYTAGDVATTTEIHKKTTTITSNNSGLIRFPDNHVVLNATVIVGSTTGVMQIGMSGTGHYDLSVVYIDPPSQTIKAYSANTAYTVSYEYYDTVRIIDP